jgi:hypothetical protein
LPEPIDVGFVDASALELVLVRGAGVTPTVVPRR